MSNNEAKKVVRKIKYRCFEKEFTDFLPTETITSQFHLELGEKNDVVIVEDRKTDWQELANKDVDKTGIRYVLSLLDKGVINPESLRFKEAEAMDLSDLNPMDPESVKKTIASKEASVAKLENTAKSLGVDVDTLVKALMNGEFATLVDKATKVAKTEESEVKE